MVTFDGPTLIDALRHLILPAVALAVVPVAFIARITQASALDVRRKPVSWSDNTQSELLAI